VAAEGGAGIHHCGKHRYPLSGGASAKRAVFTAHKSYTPAPIRLTESVRFGNKSPSCSRQAPLLQLTWCDTLQTTSLAMATGRPQYQCIAEWHYFYKLRGVSCSTLKHELLTVPAVGSRMSCFCVRGEGKVREQSRLKLQEIAHAALGDVWIPTGLARCLPK
jgi:hypothetical protein